MGNLAASSTTMPVRGVPLRLLGDEGLARLTAAGNDRAFGVLYERHHQALYRYCRTIVRHDEDARDVLQTTMARALAALGRGAPDAPMRPWLFRIAHNEAISLLRRRRPSVELDHAPELTSRSLDAQVEERSRLATLVADLDELPDRQRSALVMRELSGLSHEEIAGALDISVSAAKQAIFDARTGLHEFAKGREMDCAEVQRIVSERDGRMLRGRPLRAHLRGCASCRALRDAIGTRRADLAALAPPLPAVAATGLLSSLLGGGHGSGGLTSGLAAKLASGPLTIKALAGAAVATTVVVGTAQIAPPAHLPGLRDGARPVAAAPATGASGAAPASTRVTGVPATAARAPRGASPAVAPAPRRRRAAAPTKAHAASGVHAAATGSGPAPAATAGAGAAATAGAGAAATASAAAGHRPATPHPAPVHRAARPGRRSAAPPGAAQRRPSAPAAHAPAHPGRAGTPSPARPSDAAAPTQAPAAGRPGATPETPASHRPGPPVNAPAATPPAPPTPAAPSPPAAPAASTPAATPPGPSAAPGAPNRGR